MIAKYLNFQILSIQSKALSKYQMFEQIIALEHLDTEINFLAQWKYDDLRILTIESFSKRYIYSKLLKNPGKKDLDCKKAPKHQVKNI
jgi:hypothetical protein